MEKITIKWISVLVASSTLLILRLIDFAFETANFDFHITRMGIDMMGANAFFIQLFIIYICGHIAWKAALKLADEHYSTFLKE